MSWRTIIISQRCKLDLKMGYMVVRGESVRRVYLDEVALLMIENPAVAMTGCLLETLQKKKIRVIFCDGKRSPYAELAPYYGGYDCSRKIKLQSCWPEETKGEVWRAIMAQKITLQAAHLRDVGKTKEAALLESYVPQIEPQDVTNREGHAAKVYFNALFGMDFSRRADCPVNAALNYGYGIFLSAFNRAVNAAGYLTQLGIHHDNQFNFYNLTSDLMEPFRILVDREVKALDVKEFTKEVRYRLVDLLNRRVLIFHSEQTVLNAVEIYVRSVLQAMQTARIDEIRFYSLLKK